MVETTATHLFYGQGRGYAPAEQLREGDTLHTLDGQVTEVVSVQATGRVETVHNLAIAGLHNYHVVTSTGQAILVHNNQKRGGCGTDAGDVSTDDLPVLEISSERMPNIADNIESAIDSGHPSVLTRTSPAQAVQNRREACAGFSGPGSPDEYPFASTMEGGAGSQVRGVPLQEQYRQGGTINAFYQQNDINVGDKFKVQVTHGGS